MHFGYPFYAPPEHHYCGRCCASIATFTWTFCPVPLCHRADWCRFNCHTGAARKHVLCSYRHIWLARRSLKEALAERRLLLDSDECPGSKHGCHITGFQSYSTNLLGKRALRPPGPVAGALYL